MLITLIKLKKVSKIYGEESSTIKALDKVDLNIEEGKVLKKDTPVRRARPDCGVGKGELEQMNIV